MRVQLPGARRAPPSAQPDQPRDGQGGEEQDPYRPFREALAAGRSWLVVRRQLQLAGLDPGVLEAELPGGQSPGSRE